MSDDTPRPWSEYWADKQRRADIESGAPRDRWPWEPYEPDEADEHPAEA